jgi:hypothetical protein
MLRTYIDRFLIGRATSAPPAVRVINGETWVRRGDMWELVPDAEATAPVPPAEGPAPSWHRIDPPPDHPPWSSQEPPPERPPPFQRMP